MLSGKIPIKPLETGSTKQFRACNIPQILQHRVWNWIIITNQVWIYKKTTEFKCSRKIHDSLATIEDVMMKPVHDINHILRCTTWKTKPQARIRGAVRRQACWCTGSHSLWAVRLPDNVLGRQHVELRNKLRICASNLRMRPGPLQSE